MSDDTMDVDEQNAEEKIPTTTSTMNDSLTNARDAMYAVDEVKLSEIRKNCAWKQDPKYFQSVHLSPSAVMKMLIHCNSGVEKGMSSANGKPVEVMGLLLGRPSTDPDQLNTLIVTDVFPLPVEGAETRVLADDAEVINYMITLGETLEQTRQERFMGWYHSHPFDVEVHSHCFLSSTDVSTQLQWQRAEDPHGNPWLAIVIDPLRSLAKGQPEIGAFRVYSPEFTAPLNETPDGTIVTDENTRQERWGSCWNRYYTLKVEYFLSSMAANMVGILSKKFLWMRTLGSTPMLERENRERFSERISTLAGKLENCEVSGNHVGGGGGGRLGGGYGVTTERKGRDDSNWYKSTQSSTELAMEQCKGQLTQVAKNILFNGSMLPEDTENP